MPRKPLPSIDEGALSALARQFPASVVSVVKDSEPAAPPRAPVPTATPPAKPAPRERRRGGRLLALFALLVALVALGVAETAVMPESARLWLKAQIGNPAIADAVTGNRTRLEQTLAADASALKALEERAAASEKRLAAIEAVGGSSSAAANRIDAVEADIRSALGRITAGAAAVGALNDEIGRLRDETASQGADLKATNERIAALENDLKQSETATSDAFNPRLATLEGGLASAAKDDRVTRFFLALQELRRAAATSHPFERELAAARGLAGDNAELAAAFKTLAAYAPVGVPTPAELRDDFSLVVAPSVLALSGAGPKGVTERTVGWMRSWFAARSPSTAGDRNAALVIQAGKSLDKEQLGPAVEQVVLFEDQAALIAADWLRSASARLAVDKSLAHVMAQGFDRLAATAR